jgi:hypothetical protein
LAQILPGRIYGRGKANRVEIDIPAGLKYTREFIKGFTKEEVMSRSVISQDIS